MNLIFYLGANTGQNLSYYLKKSKVVVAVEANPTLTKIIQEQYHEYIANQSLIILNKCITTLDVDNEVVFYIHKYNSVLSTFCIPNNQKDFNRINIKSINIKSLIETFGDPDFIKIDIEGLDGDIIEQLIDLGKLPKYLQYENCGNDILQKVLLTRKYKSFNIVSFYNFNSIYNNHLTYEAGPFGNDILSPWLKQNQLCELYNIMPNSWFDLYFSAQEEEYGNIQMNFYEITKSFKNQLRKIVPKFMIMSLIRFKNITIYRIKKH